MKIDEKIDNYLISLGCSISETYAYIIDENTDFNVKPKEERVKVAGKEILLSTKVLAVMMLDQVLLGSSYVFMKSLHNVINEKGQNEVFELCEYMNTAAKVYYTDYIKYVREKFTLTDAVLENLMNLINGSIQNTSASIDKLLEKNHMQRLEAVQKAASDRAASDARIIAEAANRQRTTFSKTFSEAGFLGGVNTYTQASMGKGMSDTELAGQFEGSALFQADMEKIYKNGVNADSVAELINMMNRLILKFNRDLEEILVVKFSDLFNKDVFNGKQDVEKNPLYLDGYIPLLSNMDENDTENLKKVFDFYVMDLSDFLEKNLSNIIYEEYTKDNSFVYDKPIVKCYYNVSGKNDLALQSMQNNLYNYFKSLIDKKNNVASENYQDIKDLVNSSIYLSSENKQKLNNIMNNKQSNVSEEYKYNLFKMWASIISIVLYVPVNILLMYLMENKMLKKIHFI